MIVSREIESRIRKQLFRGKAIVIYGPRRVGKTTLTKQIMEDFPMDSLYLSCDEPDIRRTLTDKTSSELKNYLNNKKLIIIDEAQRIPNIGLTLKLLVDIFPEIQIIATGSSSFDLSNRISEPLTGRTVEFLLTPFAIKEIYPNHIEAHRLLESRLIFGSYPEVVTSPENSKEYLRSLYKNYLYKDALEFQGLKTPELIEKLLVALALQIGNEVHFTELASLLEVDKKTIASYIRLLELAFVVFRLPPLSRNLRKEISKSRKIYFWDTGIRNTIINNFNPLELRSDTGQLWENFVISERRKRNLIQGFDPNTYFWRTWTRQEVDYVEEEGGKFHGFEIKWKSKKVNPPKQWKEIYSSADWTVIDRVTFYPFI